MFGAVKVTLILCLTIVVSCVLFISYNEYSNRYSLVTTNDNSLYIFDKKSTVLNRCDGKSCSLIETKLPTKTSLNFDAGFQQSKLFDSNKPVNKGNIDKMTASKTVEAKPVNKSKVGEKISAKAQTANKSEGEAEENTEEEFVE